MNRWLRPKWYHALWVALWRGLRRRKDAKARLEDALYQDSVQTLASMMRADASKKLAERAVLRGLIRSERASRFSRSHSKNSKRVH